MLEAADLSNESDNILREHPRLGLLPSAVHLHQHGHHLLKLGAPSVERPGQFDRVQRLDHVKQFRRHPSLVALKVPHHVPLCPGSQHRDHGLGLLDVVVPYHLDPSIDGLRHLLECASFGRCHQGHMLGQSSKDSGHVLGDGNLAHSSLRS